MDVSIRQRLEDDLKTAMRAGDQTKRDTIRYILAAIKNAEIEHRGALAADGEQSVLKRVAKQLSDAVHQFRAGGREDLAAREENQLAILQSYLPTALTDEEIRTLVAQVIDDVGASGPKDMAKVMPVVIERAGNRADGRRLSGAARSALARED
jgi:uncharacterized protein YqeY